MAKSKRAKALDISTKVKQLVWERDGGRCIICGSRQAMPNAHYISRAHGGLGIPENVVTMCTMGGCHYKYDFGTREEREEIGEQIREHLMNHYPDWNEEDLIYNKYDF
jgi:hypothetical protein